FIRVGAEKLADNQMREYWLWAKSITGRSLSKSSAGSIIYDPVSAKVVAEPAMVMQAWSQHYQSLVADVTGHSRDFGFWIERFPNIPMHPALRGMDATVSWGELNGALTHLSNWKAPGLDGVPAEFYKTAAQNVQDENYDGVNP